MQSVKEFFVFNKEDLALNNLQCLICHKTKSINLCYQI